MISAALTYSVFRGDETASSAWDEVAELFSSDYGFYSSASPIRPGERIRLGAGYYRKFYATGDYHLACCRDGGRLVAEAIYRDVETSFGKVAMVVQLVVAEDYRQRGIASTLLHCIWGFSDYYAWGIVTSNAFTVESLESATFRRVCPARLAERAGWVRAEILSGIGFLAGAEWTISDFESRVASGFFTDRSRLPVENAELSSRLGTLREGEEWLAIVFRDQRPDDFAAYRSMIDASAAFVRDAYRQMPQSEQVWASKTEDEIDVILAGVPDLAADAVIVDFGAGSGRHVRELRRRGFTDTTGIDFAADDGGEVVAADCRSWKSPRPVDLALCLYDVIGSFPEDSDNETIVANIAHNLKVGGRAVISVSNFDYLDTRVIGKIDFDDPTEAAKALFSLRPETRMQDDGEFFDGNCILVDEKKHLVCHKEQFSAGSGRLPGEYLIRDRRFTAEEISVWLERAGLNVLSRRFVRAGFKIDYAVSTGKEILLFAEKIQSVD